MHCYETFIIDFRHRSALLDMQQKVCRRFLLSGYPSNRPPNRSRKRTPRVRSGAQEYKGTAQQAPSHSRHDGVCHYQKLESLVGVESTTSLYFLTPYQPSCILQCQLSHNYHQLIPSDLADIRTRDSAKLARLIFSILRSITRRLVISIVWFSSVISG